MSQNQTFEIGLVMAGAVSAGAYSGGVADYMLQAIGEWNNTVDSWKEKYPELQECLPWDVKIRVMTGASAGGMTSAMITSAMTNEHYQPAENFADTFPVTEPQNNVFYESWVKSVDIQTLLGINDLKESKNIESILDCSILDTTASAVLAHDKSGQYERYATKDLEVIVTTTNLRGVPYLVEFPNTNAAYGMMRHADSMYFILSHTEPKSQAAFWLKPGESGTKGTWGLFRESALATGAFPIALKPRTLERPITQYTNWKWWIPEAPQGNCEEQRGSITDCRCTKLRKIAPSWNQIVQREAEKSEYMYISVDGGVCNNEPLELGRRALSDEDLFLPQSADCVSRSIIMVDPFPYEDNYPINKERYLNKSIFSVIPRLLNSMKMQARFKADELEYAKNPGVFSRFLIVPHRSGAQKQSMALASSMMGAFGGFFSLGFRQHDFALGRRNSQRFFDRHFVLPVDEAANNPIFASIIQCYKEGKLTPYPELLESLFLSFEIGPGTNYPTLTKKKKKVDYIRILPLNNALRKPLEQIAWEDIQVSENELRNIAEKAERRLLKLIKFWMEEELTGFWGTIKRWLGYSGLWLAIKLGWVKIEETVYDKLKEEAQVYDLLKKP